MGITLINNNNSGKFSLKGTSGNCILIKQTNILSPVNNVSLISFGGPYDLGSTPYLDSSSFSTISYQTGDYIFFYGRFNSTPSLASGSSWTVVSSVDNSISKDILCYKIAQNTQEAPPQFSTAIDPFDPYGNGNASVVVFRNVTSITTGSIVSGSNTSNVVYPVIPSIDNKVVLFIATGKNPYAINNPPQSPYVTLENFTQSPPDFTLLAGATGADDINLPYQGPTISWVLHVSSGSLNSFAGHVISTDESTDYMIRAVLLS